MIKKNMVLQASDSKRRMRIVDEVNLTDFAVSVPTQVVWIDIDKDDAHLELIGREKLIRQIADSEYRYIEVPQPDLNIDHISAAERKLMNRRWELWLRCKGHIPQIYHPGYRGQLASELAAKGIASKPFFYGMLRRIFQHGPTYSSLATNLHRCGAPGASRISEQAVIKLGRPRSVQPGVGLVMTEAHLRNMRFAWAKSPVGRDGRNLKSCWVWMLTVKYSEYVGLGVKNEISVENYDHVPTFEQFQYHWKREHDFNSRALLRYQARKFKSMFKPLLTGTLKEVTGPGQRYYIDATVIDIYGVSRSNSNQIIGRPTLYVVVDQFSRMIVGMYVGLEPPCWVGAMLALWNCSQDKVEFCAKYGVDIQPESWPVGGIPKHLMGDRGELMAHDAERLLHGFNIDVENSTPYSGDAKGVVERVFNTLQTKFGPYIPGYVDKEFLGRGNKPPALDAILNLTQITSCLIKGIIIANQRIIKGYDAGPDLINNRVPCSPISLWHWGVDNLTAGFRTFDESHLRKHLWPQARLKLHKNGAKLYRGLYYFGAALHSQPWYLQAQKNGDELSAYYHPTDMTSAIVIPPDARSGQFEVTLTPRCEKFSHLGFSELVALDKRKSITNAEAKWQNLNLQASMESAMHAEVKAAKKEAARQRDSSLSVKERIANIKANKRRELDEMDAVVQASMTGERPLDLLPVVHTPSYEEQDDEYMLSLIRKKLDSKG